MEKEKELLKTITDRYSEQTSPYYAASRLWTDAIIDPLETRKVILSTKKFLKTKKKNQKKSNSKN